MEFDSPFVKLWYLYLYARSGTALAAGFFIFPGLGEHEDAAEGSACSESGSAAAGRFFALVFGFAFAFAFDLAAALLLGVG